MEPYRIGKRYTVYMAKGNGGFHGHYTDHKKGFTNTFTAPGMSKKAIIRKFWDRSKEDMQDSIQ